MKLKKSLSAMLALVLSTSMIFTGCGKKDKDLPAVVEKQEQEQVIANPDEYIDLALNVYYNDSDHNYYENETGESIRVYNQGQYTVEFDVTKDLSQAAQDAGVVALKNLTAVYIADAGVAEGKQSPLSKCNIVYNSVIVDGTELTINNTEPKSAFKSSGIFDTNDPINAWDGSSVDEIIVDKEKHVANFDGIANASKISVTFTLSGMIWSKVEVADKEENVDTGYVNTTKFSDIDFTDMEALEFTKLMGNGINLGNTMEAYGHKTAGINSDVKTYETYWGQPQTTAAMLQGMKDCGFDSIRIPVAWTNMMDYENGDYTINTAYLDRVQEIVDYAIAAEMIVIVNDHWDGGWWAMFGSKSEDTREEAMKLYTEMWSQICERFKDYSDMLVFESANEELGDGLNNNSAWTDSGSLSGDEVYEKITEINQAFVDTVRASGGNNDDRFLLIAGFNTDIDRTCDSRYKMPTDTATAKLLLSVHYYTPWNYCGAETQSKWGTIDDYEQMNTQFEKMKKYTDLGYGIVIGEYAALPVYDSATSTHSLKENTLEFTTNLLDNCDYYNYVPMLWSCNDYFNKTRLTMINDEILDLFTSRCYAEEVKAGDGYLDDVKANMDANLAAAPEQWETTNAITTDDSETVAWIMWNGGAGTYSVGDKYNPNDNTAGITATDVIVDGAGDYSVSLDFAKANNGLTFAALAIANGEIEYPNCIINIKEILINGEAVTLAGQPYTSSDDGKCTRVNLLNEWIGDVPGDARTMSGGTVGCTPILLDKNDCVGISNITINFTLVVK